MTRKLRIFYLTLIATLGGYIAFAQTRPDIIIIYADDLGYGDISANGATKIKTPNIDRLAAHGLRFTNAYATSATCTPSRFSMLTGKYAWRKQGTGIAKGDEALLIPTDITTLPGMLRKAGYETGVVGKWHLGLGPKDGPDWNSVIKPGPLELGFNYSFIIPATLDRVPTVYVEGHRIVNLDPADPIRVSYTTKVGNEPTGLDHPEMLKFKADTQHSQTIVNGISRIGYMSGGKSAYWKDEEIGDVITGKAISFIQENRTRPFFLYFAVHGIHVPRVPNPRFAGKSGIGSRGDAILEMDDITGKILKVLDSLKLTDHTLVIFSSDNGPVLNDGYQDQAAELLNGHKPGGPLRGGKYSAFEAGTRVPFIVRWPGKVKPGTVTDAKISQVDLYASLASIIGVKISGNNAPDSFDMSDVLLGKTQSGRDYIVQQALNNTLSVIRNDWKYIEPHNGPKILKGKDIETGNDSGPQLYNLKNDIGEKVNVADRHTDLVKEMSALLKKIKDNNTIFIK